MVTHTVALEGGWKIGEETYHEVELREPHAIDVLESECEAERSVPVDGGVEIAASPAMAAHNLLARCIMRIGDMKEPAPTREYFKGLGAADYRELVTKASVLAYGAEDEVRKRGRAGPSPAGAGGGDDNDLDGDGLDPGGSRRDAAPASETDTQTG